MQWLMIALGAAVGAMLRGWLVRYNTLHSWLPFGTLLANVLGGLLMGVALAYADRLSPNLRLLLMTGLLGGLTTFSSFSAEVINLVLAKQMSQAIVLIGLHLALTLGATLAGLCFCKTYL